MVKKTIWITGGTKGLGRDLVAHYSALDNSVITNYHKDDEAAQELAAWAVSHGAPIETIKADVCSPDEMKAVAEHIQKHYGTLDLLICNAGEGIVSPVEATSPALFHSILDVNLLGKYHCVYHAIPLLKASGQANIVLIGSAAGEKASVGMSAYCCSQAGVIMLTKALAKELTQYGIRTNCICPSMMDSGMSGRCFSPEDRHTVTQLNPSRRLCNSGDVIACLDWLCSENAGYVNGEIVHLTGGNS